ncbi:putative membrane protein [Actinoalloteichus hoggarensis]|uniref:Uncharacterized protein n=1 Tax=Actinoalloteichus hoggarensis TaxID=1470176 RepID=A0A221W5F0_9PSEU|nr:hypothetical protein [Actinoalloteichus hoggarensis]ASO20809.1 hypothetical protein AHOG_15915 [Actinoalloteichus hoggarensis]MBB5920739.1 putative membrane protein [Actinoalloteichus hoggarensis]
MTAHGGGTAARRPWHLWLVAIAMFALYIGGARDYLLILVGDTEYIHGQFGPGGLAYFTDYPQALRVVWTVTILGGLIAPLLLMARSRLSFPTAAIATAAQFALLVATFVALDRWSMLGAATAWFDIGVGVVTMLFTWYCWTLRRRGVLA